MTDFAALDFETANGERTSVCSVGVVVVRDGQVADTFYSLIQPEPNYYNYWCQRVHGLSRDDTHSSPTCGHALPLRFKVCRWWRITRRSMRVASRLYSAVIRWTIPTILSSARCKPHAASSSSCAATSWTTWPKPAAM